jgi:uncharacterized protein (TIGR00290 family)
MKPENHLTGSTWMSWSTGKDSAYALCRLIAEAQHKVTGLFTTVTDVFERVSMHGVREALLQRQANAIGLPLHRVMIPPACINTVYEEKMNRLVGHAIAQGVTHMAFGDLFLHDIRLYREERLAPSGIRPVFPLWKEPTDLLARRMIASGIKAILTCVDPRKLPPSFAGREFNLKLLNELPPGTDPCGENGEFHTFVYDAPIFMAPIPIEVGEVIERDGFVFADVREI